MYLKDSELVAETTEYIKIVLSTQYLPSYIFFLSRVTKNFIKVHYTYDRFGGGSEDHIT